MPVVPAKRELRNSGTELPMGVMQPRPVTTTRFNAAPLDVALVIVDSLEEHGEGFWLTPK